MICGSCIEPFQPVIKEEQKSLVINGVITDQSGSHQVTISRSSPYLEALYDPVTGCVVRVEDESGNLVLYEEIEPGIYEAHLTSPFLGLNKAYSLMVTTLEGEEYHSSYDTMLVCPPIDTLYYEIESHSTRDHDVNLYGFQFYSELTGTESASSYFRWQLEETWEYNSAALTNAIWNGGIVEPVMADTVNTCYMTGSIPGLYSASTHNLSENRLIRNKLNFVSNTTPRIKLQYSLLVWQHSLSSDAYRYWEIVKSQSGDSGGLYETQPASATGNIYNSNHPEEKVLGYFYATQVQSKRITVKNEFEFVVPGFSCELDTINSLGELGSNFPHYLYSLDPLGVGPPYITGADHCFNCQLNGGTNEKPDYWQ